MGKINIKINKGGIKSTHLINNVQDGPELSDIKEGRGRKKNQIIIENAPRILKIKEKKLKKFKKNRKFKFKIVYLITLIFLVILGFVLYFGYNYLKKDRILRKLPESTVFFGKIDLGKVRKDYNEEELGKIIESIFPKDQLNKEIVKVINDKILLNYGLDFRADIAGEVKNEVSIASFQDSDNQSNLHTIIALEVRDKKNIKDIINKSIDIDYINNYSFERSDIYEIIFKNEKNNFYYTFSDNFLLLAKDDRALENILTVSAKKKTSLVNSQNFKKAVPLTYRFENNYFYTNLSLITFDKIQNNDFFGLEFSKSFITYAFLKKIGPMSFYFKPDQNSLNLYGHSSRKEEKSAEANLSNFVLNKATAVYTGYNIQEDLIEYSELLDEEDSNVFSIKNIIGILEREYDLNLEEDIKPLFEKESEIAIISEEGRDELLATLNIQDSLENKKKMEKLEKAASSYFGIIYPTESEFNLADGSIGFELFANDKAFPFKDIKLSDVKIRSIVNPDIPQHYAYTFYNNNLILSTSEKILEEAIQAEQNNENLNNDKDYKRILSGRISDNNIFYLDLMKIYDKIGISKNGFYNRFKKFVLTQENKANGTDFVGTFLVE